MSRATSDVVPVGRREAARVGEVLGRAFYDSDQWAAVLSDPNARQAKLEQMFAGAVKLTLAAHGIAERTGGFEAVALWLPGRVGFWPLVKSGFASARFAVTPPFPNIRRLTAMLRQFEDIHRQRMPGKHWYLMALGVDPEHQRGGHGSALVRRGIQRADAANLPIYLETKAGSNVTFYQRLGFEVLDELTVDAYNLSFTLMIRRAEGARPSRGGGAEVDAP